MARQVVCITAKFECWLVARTYTHTNSIYMQPNGNNNIIMGFNFKKKNPNGIFFFAHREVRADVSGTPVSCRMLNDLAVSTFQLYKK